MQIVGLAKFLWFPFLWTCNPVSEQVAGTVRLSEGWNKPPDHNEQSEKSKTELMYSDDQIGREGVNSPIGCRWRPHLQYRSSVLYLSLPTNTFSAMLNHLEHSRNLSTYSMHLCCIMGRKMLFPTWSVENKAWFTYLLVWHKPCLANKTLLCAPHLHSCDLDQFLMQPFVYHV